MLGICAGRELDELGQLGLLDDWRPELGRSVAVRVALGCCGARGGGRMRRGGVARGSGSALAVSTQRSEVGVILLDQQPCAIRFNSDVLTGAGNALGNAIGTLGGRGARGGCVSLTASVVERIDRPKVVGDRNRIAGAAAA